MLSRVSFGCCDPFDPIFCAGDVCTILLVESSHGPSGYVLKTSSWPVSLHAVTHEAIEFHSFNSKDFKLVFLLLSEFIGSRSELGSTSIELICKLIWLDS